MRGYAKIKENNPFFVRSKSKKEYPFLDPDFDVHQEFESRLDIYSSDFPTKKPQENDQKPSILVQEDTNNNKKDDFFQRKSEEHIDDHNEKQDVKKNDKERKGVLRRNFTVSSSTTSSSLGYQKNGNNNHIKSCNLERQSSTRAIQEAVKRAFSMRRSSSVNSDRYCRIYDQPKNVEDFEDNHHILNPNDNHNDSHNHNDGHSHGYYDDYVYDFGNHGRFNHPQNDHDDYDHDDHEEFEGNGSMETKYMGLKKKKNKDECNSNSNNGKKHVGSKVVKACKRLFSR